MFDVQTIQSGDMLVRVSGAGAPLILLHGYTTTAEFWREQVDAFSAGYRVIRPNLPGHGISPSPKQRAYTIDAFVADLEHMFEQFELRDAVLVGLSMGGVIAQQFALKHPARLRALAVVDTTSHGFGPDVQVDNVFSAIDRLGVVAASQQVARRSFSPSTPAALIHWAEQEVAQTPEFVAREAVASLGTIDNHTALAQLDVPTLVMVGGEDRITPLVESRKLNALIRGSQLEIIEHAAHFPMLEQPEAFNHALKRFLDSLSQH
ncbi:alpha/beta fold hydrolase [Paraburkholderia humisilvae]|uniref:3-oxoadipate enol-lactonase 2 n=1 Tax=Paraburkholderia humisilvae TaxID=627669 RepID=A0A6J5D4U2_9BURK|nr:alpha/beta hydrolase [Paraburkholderia humisilvae]CAB3749379.1 3-oxoadipate enol-lactonase 2 [Paraburkholderia humisilvae]